MSLLHTQHPTERGSDFDKLPPKGLSESDIATIPEQVLVTFLKSNIRNKFHKILNVWSLAASSTIGDFKVFSFSVTSHKVTKHCYLRKLKYHQINGTIITISIPTYIHCFTTEPSNIIPISLATNNPTNRDDPIAAIVIVQGCN